MKIVVAIPCYNCEQQVTRVLGSFDGDLLARISKVIVINNRSTDKTVVAALQAGKRLGEKFELYTNDDNYWLGGSHKVAFQYAATHEADYIAIVHGDDQAKVAELSTLIDLAEQNPSAAAILGARFLPKSRLVGYSKLRIAGNHVLNAIFSLVTLRPVRDLGSGLNVFRVQDLNPKAYLKFGDNMTFNIDLLLYYFRIKATIIFTPITWTESDQVSNARNATIAKTALKQLFKWRLGLPTAKPKHTNYPSSRITHA